MFLVSGLESLAFNHCLYSCMDSVISMKQKAESDFRSVNGQIEWTLQKMLVQEGRLKN